MNGYPIGQKALSLLLCFALVCSIFSLDTVGAYAADAKYIVGFEELAPEVAVQHVALGTPEANLSLPKTLRAKIRTASDSGTSEPGSQTLVSSEPEPEDTQSGAEKPSVDSEDSSKAESSSEPGGQTLVSSEPERDAQSGAEKTSVDSESSSPAENETEPEKKPDDPDLKNLPVTWTPSPDYDGNTAGKYRFTPELPEGYTLADGVSVPEINVTVGAFAAVNDSGFGATLTSQGNTLTIDSVWSNASDISGYDTVQLPNTSPTAYTTLTASGENVKIVGQSGVTYQKLTIVIKDSAEVTIKNLTIKNDPGTDDYPAVDVQSADDGNTLYLDSGSCMLQGGLYQPGIRVEGSNQITIDKAPGVADDNAAALDVSSSWWAAAIGGEGNNYGNGYDCGTVNIRGGKIGAYTSQNYNVTGNGAGIGGGGGRDNGGNGGTVNIFGGIVTAKGGLRGGAGIGGSCGNAAAGGGGCVTITGGSVTATGGEDGGAGIGGGGNSIAGSGGTINITGGTVTANGGEYGGAGIGGGGSSNISSSNNGGAGGNIKIDGGMVYAYGGKGGGIKEDLNHCKCGGGAGIGGGGGYTGGAGTSGNDEINISGGDVTAISNYYGSDTEIPITRTGGAGIGGGGSFQNVSSSCGTICISGGARVNASAEALGTGIGVGTGNSGAANGGGTVTVSGAGTTVTASGSGTSSDIGSNSLNVGIRSDCPDHLPEVSFESLGLGTNVTHSFVNCTIGGGRAGGLAGTYYALNYDLGGGTNAPSAPDTYKAGVGISTLSIPSKAGCAFAGWYTDPSFSAASKVTSISAEQTGIVTLSARWLSQNAKLSGLSISVGSLSPVFSSTVMDYTANVGNNVSKINVTPTTSIAGATIQVNGTAATSGAVSGDIALTPGSATEIDVTVTAQDGETADTYKILVTRAPSSDAALSGLTISSGTLSPVFSSTGLNYTANVDNSVSSVTVIPTTTAAGATITVNNVAVASGTASGSIGLTAGGATEIDVTVTAQDGVTTGNYKINVTRRAPASDAALSGLTVSPGVLSPAFAAGTVSYTANVGSGISKITVIPVTREPHATVTVNGSPATGRAGVEIPLNGTGTPTVIVVEVTAQNGSKQVYHIAVARASSGSSGGASTPSLPSSVTDAPTNLQADLSGATFPAWVTGLSLAVTPSWPSSDADPQTAAASQVMASSITPNTIGSPFLYNIKLLDQSGNPVTFTGSVTVRLPLPSGLRGTPHVFRYEPDTKSFTDMNAKVENGFLVFSTTHFSNYVVAGMGNAIVLDTLNYQMPVGGKYQIGVKLAGTKASSVKFHSTNDKIATVVKMKNGNYQVDGKETGTVYIMFDVYDNKNHLLTHASVKVDVKTGIRPRGDSTRQIGVF